MAMNFPIYNSSINHLDVVSNLIENIKQKSACTIFFGDIVEYEDPIH